MWCVLRNDEFEWVDRNVKVCVGRRWVNGCVCGDTEDVGMFAHRFVRQMQVEAVVVLLKWDWAIVCEQCHAVDVVGCVDGVNHGLAVCRPA